MTGERLRVGSITVDLSNTGKVLFPGDNITKGDLVEHYHRVTQVLLRRFAG